MEIRTSVRNLVEFILREGDIDNRHASKSDAMLEGGRIHRMIQRRMGPNYHSEYALNLTIPNEKFNIVIDGRADGILFEYMDDVVLTPLIDEKGEELGLIDVNSIDVTDISPSAKDVIDNNLIRVTIDEIKGTYRDIYRMKNEEPLHLAQAKCYAYIYAFQNTLSSIRVRITYCNIETEDIRYFHYDFEFSELKEWFDDLIGEYYKWALFEYEWKEKRTATIKSLEFPFEYRRGQKELVTYVYRTIYHKRKLFIEAPTGVGKTIATVFPTVKAMGEGLCERVFYLTAKTITRTVAEQAFGLLREQGLSFKTVTLTAKDKICFLDESDCNPLACEYAKGHYNRVNEALFDILTNSDNFSRDEILKYAVKHRVCPFEFSLDIALFADSIICDYNYLFDPRAYLRRFFTEGVREDYAFLIDEAHNLVERGRDMYSASLIKEDLLKMKAITRDYSKIITSALESCNKEMLSLKRCSDGCRILEAGEESALVRKLIRLNSLIEDYLEEQDDSPIRKELLLFYFDLSFFLLIYEKLGDDYTVYTDFMEDNSFYIKLFNVDPSKNLGECMMRGRSTILFSATLLPIDYYKNLLSATKEDYEVYAESVFDMDRRGLFVATDVTSRYKRRNENEYIRIAEYIYKMASARQGNYMVFFPSFAFMNSVYEAYTAQYGEENILVQDKHMNEEGREEFLKAFSEDNDKTLLGMCVLGGVFSEGIDLKAERLIGAAIVGTGIPLVCSERELLKKHFDKDGVSGYDYAYKYPGMNKVLQAAGRVIRTAEDYGVVLLLDERLMETSYLRMFPREWGNYQLVNLNNVKDKLDGFWKNW